VRPARQADLTTATDLAVDASENIAGSMNSILADVFALYLKTKNFHWHMSGPHFRERRAWFLFESSWRPMR
jgi:starvation-inducible DNA-binding protein